MKLVARALILVLWWNALAFAQGGQCSGFTPNKWAAPADVGNGNGLTEANAMDLPTAIAGGAPADVICAIPGTYSAPAQVDQLSGAFGFSTSGTAGNPIRLVSKFPAAYILDANLATQATQFRFTTPFDPFDDPTLNSSCIATQAQDYVEIWGIYIDTSLCPSPPGIGGPVGLTGGEHLKLEEARIDSIEMPDNDNYSHVFIQGTTDVVVKNNLFKGGAGPHGHNNAAIFTYGAIDTVIEHNEGDGINSFLFVKGQNIGQFNSGSARFNYIHGASSTDGGSGVGTFTLNEVEEGLFFDIYQNLMVGVSMAFEFDDSSGPVGEVDPHARFRVFKNTVVNAVDNNTYWANKRQAASALYDNIFYQHTSGSVPFNSIEGSPMPAGTISPFDYNLYYENGGTVTFSHNTGSSLANLSAWIAVSGEGAHSSATTSPGFVSAGTGNYRLAGGSAALTFSSTGGPVGAYQTGSETMGIEGAGSAPSVGTGLKRLRIKVPLLEGNSRYEDRESPRYRPRSVVRPLVGGLWRAEPRAGWRPVSGRQEPLWRLAVRAPAAHRLSAQ